MKNSNVPSFKSPLNRSTFNVFETQDMELRTSRLIETCSNSFKDKTEDGWVVTRAKTKVSGRLNFLPLHQNVLDGLPHSIRPQWYFRQVAAGEQLTFHYQGGLKVSNIVLTFMQSLLKKTMASVTGDVKKCWVRFLNGKLFSWKISPFSGFSYFFRNFFFAPTYLTQGMGYSLEYLLK